VAFFLPRQLNSVDRFLLVEFLSQSTFLSVEIIKNCCTIFIVGLCESNGTCCSLFQGIVSVGNLYLTIHSKINSQVNVIIDSKPKEILKRGQLVLRIGRGNHIDGPCDKSHEEG
jgi:hypothetical protein